MSPVRLPAVRVIKGTRRVVGLIVICDACGNREIGWAWRDDSHEGLVRCVNEIDPHPDLGDGYFRSRGYRDDEPEPEWAEYKRQHGRLQGPDVERPIEAYFVEGTTRLFAYCPRHGGTATRDSVDPLQVTSDSTLRVRAYPRPTR